MQKLLDGGGKEEMKKLSEIKRAQVDMLTSRAHKGTDSGISKLEFI
jgi:hypothetical protein